MLKFIFIAIWFIFVTLIIIPSNYFINVLVLIFSLLWGYKLFIRIKNETIWNGYTQQKGYYKDKTNHPWKDMYFFFHNIK